VVKRRRWRKRRVLAAGILLALFVPPGGPPVSGQVSHYRRVLGVEYRIEVTPPSDPGVEGEAGNRRVSLDRIDRLDQSVYVDTVSNRCGSHRVSSRLECPGSYLPAPRTGESRGSNPSPSQWLPPWVFPQLIEAIGHVGEFGGAHRQGKGIASVLGGYDPLMVPVDDPGELIGDDLTQELAIAMHLPGGVSPVELRHLINV
jgi:hypothetical protein